MIITITCTILILGVIARTLWRPKNFPSGPQGLPIVGFTPLMKRYDKKYWFKAMRKLSESYGALTGFFMGPIQTVISVCGFEAIQDVLHNPALDGRPHFNMALTDEDGHALGVMHSKGPLWEEHRKFASGLLADFAFSSETLMTEEISDLIEEVDRRCNSTADRTVDLQGVFTASVLNILWGIITGQRLKRDDEKLRQIAETLQLMLEASKSPGIFVRLHRLVYRIFPSFQSFFGHRQQLLQPLVQLIEEIIDRDEYEPSNSSQKTFIQFYLKEKEKEAKRTADIALTDSNTIVLDIAEEKGKQNKATTSTFTKKQLIATVIDFFAAGSETSANTIGFALLHLLHDRDVQKKVQQELDAVCGENLPTLADKSNLPYTEAFLMEAQRMSSVTPLGVAHFSLSKTQLGKYRVPKGCIILLNLFDVHNDESYWGDPHLFRPERHFSSDGKLIKSDHFMPFGSGKRECMGKSLAENLYYLFVTSMIKTFHFENVAEQPLPTLEPIEGPTLRYEGFQTVLTVRHDHTCEMTRL